MRFKLIMLLQLAVLFHASLSWGETSLFKACFEQREVVATIFFGRGSSHLDQAAAADLNAALKRIRELTCPSRLIRIEGFSGFEGSDEHNFRLSMNRANSVAQFLKRKGVPCLVGVNGYGDLHAGQNGTASDLRVEIVAYPKMFIFDFDNARQVAAQEVRLP